MITINKDLKAVPISLSTDEKLLRRNPTKTTYERRLEIIRNGQYPPQVESRNYDERYKYRDFRTTLEVDLYHRKCAYCETDKYDRHIEHYRPKRGGYYWLAFSWDNLIVACSKCNENKGNKFPLEEGHTRVLFENTPENIANINCLSAQYDAIEHPLLLNPEAQDQSTLDALHHISFDRETGEIIKGQHPRMDKTREVCDLNRKDLCQDRKKIWDDFCKEIDIAVKTCWHDKRDRVLRLKQICQAFETAAYSPENSYLAFRQCAIRENWFRDLMKELTSSQST